MKSFDGLLEGVKKAAVAGHVKPDGDCVGSCLATYNYIKEYYPQIEVTLYLEPIPNIFKFLKRSEEIVSSFEEDMEYDLFIAQDCGDIGRLGKAAKYFHAAKRTACIDHHISNESFAGENHIFPYASSTSELVYGLLEEEKITKEIAECIYVGIVHDTGVFQYESASAKTMHIAGKLMDLGINFPKIVDDTFYTKTFEQNQILGKALLAAKLYAGGQVIASVVTKEDMDACHVQPRHLEGIVNQLRVTKGVEAAVFLYEVKAGGFKVSLRSNRLVDVAKLAAGFGGGGHARAAGFSMEEDAETVIQKTVEAIVKQLS